MPKFLRSVFVLTVAMAFSLLLPVKGHADDEPLAQVIKRAKQATVGILQSPEDAGSHPTKTHFSIRGTGVHIGKGYILTARHAVERTEGGKTVIPKTIAVLTGDLDELPALFIGANTFLDIALYRVKSNVVSSLMAFVPFGDLEPQSGEAVFTVGYPLGWGPAIGFGHVGNTQAFLPTAQSRLMQVDVPACSGNSGGGLFNTKGTLVGVLHAIIQTETTQGERRCSRFAFVVPGSLVQRMSAALIHGEHPGFSKLGVQLTTVKVGTHWRVAIAKATGPARKGGLRKGDILLAIEEIPVTTAAQLKNYLIEYTRPGQPIAIRILRGETEKLFFVTMGKA